MAVLYLLVSCDPSTPIPNNPTAFETQISWQGELDSYPSNPKEGYAFYHTVEGSSYIYVSGKWETLAKSGSGLVWLGECPDYPASPHNGDAFYHTVLGNSYVYDGSTWKLLARSGNDGASGLLNWMGSYPVAPSNPSEGWAYHNEIEGISYIYTNEEWKIFSYDGQSIIWLGELREAPTSPSLNMAYFNTTDNTSYIWNGSSWSTLAGNSNIYYKVSIIWKGDFSSAPTNPDIGWMYYNTSTGKSYVWTGSAWEVVASDGISPVGFLIQWKGSLSTNPENAQIGWAYHNTGNNSTYLYDGAKWCLMVRGENVLSSFSTAKMQVKVDGETVSPSQSIPINYSGSEMTVGKTIEVSNIGSEILYFSDFTPLINNIRGNVDADTSGFRNTLNPGESFSIILNFPTNNYFSTTINFYNSSLDSPWSINFSNSNYSYQYIYLYTYFYPYSNSSVSEFSKYSVYYGSAYAIADNPSDQELDFGRTDTSGEYTPRYSFLISVQGTEAVHISGNPAIYITGKHEDCFQIETISNTNITFEPSSSYSPFFSVIFNPDSLGNKSAILHIPTDMEGVEEIQYRLVGTAVENSDLFVENGFVAIQFENDNCARITQDGNGGLYLISESYYKNSKYYYEIIHMDSKGNTADRFSIEADSYDPMYAEWSSNTLTVYSRYGCYTINSETHSYTRTYYTYNIDTPKIDDQTYWRILQYGDYKFGLTSYSDGIVIAFNNENEKLATYYGKVSSYLADACISDRYLYSATDDYDYTSIVRRIDLDELMEDMTDTFF
jgi:hypothetical protein